MTRRRAVAPFLALLLGAPLIGALATRSTSQARDSCATASMSCPFVAELLRGREGYGREARGGLDGEIVTVSSSADSGPGSLRDALAGATGPRWIRFAADMTIDLAEQLRAPDHVTIDGRGHAIVLHDFGVSVVGAQHVILTHLTIDGRFRQFAQAVNIANGARDVWINNLDLSRFKDRLLNVKTGATDVTISRVKFHDHNKVMLLNNMTERNLFANVGRDSALRVTLFGNWFVDTIQRNPRAQFGTVHLYNNLLENWDFYGMSFSLEAKALIEGNIFANDPRRPCAEPEAFETTHGIDRNYCHGIARAPSRAILPNGAADKAQYDATRAEFGYAQDYRAFIRLRDNVGLGESDISDYRPEQVPAPPYCYHLLAPDAGTARLIRAHAGNVEAPWPEGARVCPN